jgi:DNA-binding response OmpR family regulator
MLEKDYLETRGYDVKIINSGIEGLNEAVNNSYNLIVLDIMLPGIDGFRILKIMREKTDIPVLLVSAKALEIDKIKGLGLGADDYITKPFNFNEFLARVDAHLSRYERLTEKINGGSGKLIFDGLLIEPQQRKVFVNGNEVFLTNKEFELLYHLARNENIVFSKEKLMDAIWGYDSLGETSTVTVHVKRVREKLEKVSCGKSYLQTVWGAGYRFSVE